MPVNRATLQYVWDGHAFVATAETVAVLASLEPGVVEGAE
jgi:hypothetical protein